MTLDCPGLHNIILNTDKKKNSNQKIQQACIQLDVEGTKLEAPQSRTLVFIYECCKEKSLMPKSVHASGPQHVPREWTI